MLSNRFVFMNLNQFLLPPLFNLSKNKKLPGEVSSFSCQIGAQNTKLNYRWKIPPEGRTAAVVVLCYTLFTFRPISTPHLSLPFILFTPFQCFCFAKCLRIKSKSRSQNQKTVSDLCEQNGQSKQQLAFTICSCALQVFPP